jgi:hypothetical protein
MEELENLGQRIYDIQQCLSRSVSGGIDTVTIADLAAKMDHLERTLSSLEARIDAQVAYAQEIPDVVAAVKELFFMCQDIPAPDRPEASSVVLELKKSSSSRIRSTIQVAAPADAPPLIASTSVVNDRLAKTPSEEPMPADCFVRHVTDEDLKGVSRAVFFRVPIAKVNGWIDEINLVLSKKQQVIKLPSNVVKSALKRLWERYDSEKLEDDPRLFFTMEDVKDMSTLKNSQKNALTLLQSLGRIYSSTDSQLKRWFVK